MKRVRSGDLFPTDSPLSPVELIGRSEEVDQLTLALRGGVNTVLAQPRRIGKTSTCEAALASLGDTYYSVSIDLWDVNDILELADILVLRLVSNRPPLRSALQLAFQKDVTFPEALHGAAKLTTGQIGLPREVTDAFETVIELRKGDDPFRYLAEAAKLLELVAIADEKRIILFLDEFQDILRLGDLIRADGGLDAAKRLRSVFQRSTQVTFLFAGSIEHMMSQIFGNPKSPFGNFGSFFSLAPIPAAAWEEGIRERLARDDCTIDQLALQKLIEYGEGHPRATMLIAQQAHLKSVFMGSRKIGIDTVEYALIEAMSSERPKHQQNVE